MFDLQMAYMACLTAPDLLAEEAVAVALAHTRAQIAEGGDGELVPEGASLEVSALIRCFDALVCCGAWGEGWARVGVEAWEPLLGRHRRHALGAASEVATPAALASLVHETARFLFAHSEAQEAGRTIATLSLQITMAILSLMRAHAVLESRRLIIDTMLVEGEESSLHALRRRLAAFEPSQNRDVIAWRFQRAGWDEADPAIGSFFVGDAALRFEALTPHYAEDSACFEAMADFLTSAREPSGLPMREALASWLHISAFLPYDVLVQQFLGMPQAAQMAWAEYLQTRFPALPLTNSLAWLMAQATLERALGFLILGDFEALAGVAGRDMSPEQTQTLITLKALGLRAQGAPRWASNLLRHPFDPPSLPELWPDLSMIYVSLRAEAWCSQGAANRGIDELRQALSLGLEGGDLSLAFAVCYLHEGDFGQAESWLDTAASALDSQRFAPRLLAANSDIARAALAQARRARVVELPFLELAMKRGDADTFAQAALCWFDSQSGADRLAIFLAEARPEHRRAFVSALGARSAIDCDAVHELNLALSAHSPHSHELPFLQALAGLDNAYQAPALFLHAMSAYMPSDPCYWFSAERYLGLCCEARAFDEAARGIAPALIHADDPRAQRLLRLLLAQTPRDALMVVQQTLCDSLGMAECKAIFSHLKTPTPPPAEPSTTDYPLAFMSPPLAWQVFYRAANLLRAKTQPERGPDQNKRTSSRPVAMPEPTEAAWQLRRQERASDAFDA